MYRLGPFVLTWSFLAYAGQRYPAWPHGWEAPSGSSSRAARNSSPHGVNDQRIPPGLGSSNSPGSGLLGAVYRGVVVVWGTTRPGRLLGRSLAPFMRIW